MGRIIEPLQKMGVLIQGEEGCAPLTLGRSARPLRGLNYTLNVSSAQVKSCLLLAALAGDAPTTLTEPGASRDHTERMLVSMGVRVDSLPPTAGVHAAQSLSNHSGSESQSAGTVTRLTPSYPIRLTPLNLSLPGDISSAAFLIVAALITPGSQIYLQNIGLNPTRTGLIEALVEMDADIQIVKPGLQGGEPAGDLVVRASALHGARVSDSLVVRMIDEFPAFAIAAAFAQGQTVVSQAEELRHKESDRITALCAELRCLGVQVEEAPDGFTIAGGTRPQGGEVTAHGDHRLAMALALVGLAARRPVTVHGAEVIGESFPEFTAALTTLGARVESGAPLSGQMADLP
jgi:3-phosphoshikimate 1-carboxyvinyltransferase